jgi:hypothetical protein
MAILTLVIQAFVSVVTLLVMAFECPGSSCLNWFHSVMGICSMVIGDNYFSRLTTIIFTVFFKKINGLTRFYLLTSSGHLLTHRTPYETQKSLSRLAFSKVSFGSSPSLRQSFAWASGELVIFKISFPHIPTVKA